MLPNELLDKYLLIDGDLIRYRCGFAIDAQNKGRDDLLDFIVVTIRSFSGSDPVSTGKGEVWLSGPTNFRTSIGTSKPYKGNRANRAKPRYYEEIGEILKTEFQAKETVGIEADDELAIKLSEAPRDRVCVSFDKDMRQVSGWHYDWIKHTAQWISRKAGDFHLYHQILAGDPTDNVQGIAGLGPVGAAKILKDCKSSRELCERSWDAYRARGLDGKYFLETANLVYLLRSPDDCYSMRQEYDPRYCGFGES